MNCNNREISGLIYKRLECDYTPELIKINQICNGNYSGKLFFSKNGFVITKKSVCTNISILYPFLKSKALAAPIIASAVTSRFIFSDKKIRLIPPKKPILFLYFSYLFS